MTNSMESGVWSGTPGEVEGVAAGLASGLLTGSARAVSGALLWAERDGAGERIAVATAIGSSAGGPLAALSGERTESGSWSVHRVARSASAMLALRDALPNLRPTPLGLATSAGLGDRLGLATPGHADSFRATNAVGVIAPIFAQQSIRENSRTGRTPLGVLDDATWGAFSVGWQQPVGADADHLKTTADVDSCLAAGYSFFTVDPGDHVNAAADDLHGGPLEEAFAALPWDELGTSPEDLRARLAGLRLDIGDAAVTFGPGELERAAVKYGRAVAHVVRMARHLTATATHAVELEVSVDETPTPTSFGEHVYFVTELSRLGVKWVSLAPRFVGEFEKGVEYIGNLGELAGNLRGHAAIARQLGPYKLSLHSGSDKFAVYPIAAEAAGGLVHLKTAGTSYLEALRVIGYHEPDLLMRIARAAQVHFAEDVHSYSITGTVAGMPDLGALKGTAITTLLDHVDSRQVLHVTFGSALHEFGSEITAVLERHPDTYRAGLRRHFERHLAPLVATATGGATLDLGGAGR